MVQHHYRRQYGMEPPLKPTIRKGLRKFLETGSVLQRQGGGRPSVSDERMVAEVKAKDGWGGIGVFSPSTSLKPVYKAMFPSIIDEKNGKYEKLKNVTWGGIHNRVFVFKGRKTFMVETDNPKQLQRRRKQASLMQYIPSLRSRAPFSVSRLTCLTPCRGSSKGFYLFGEFQNDGEWSQSNAGAFIPSCEKWFPLPPFGLKLTKVAGTSLENGTIFLLGGEHCGKRNRVVKSVCLYDVRVGKRYSTLPDIPEPICEAAATVLSGRQLLLVGGSPDQATSSNQTSVLDLNNLKWDSSSSSSSYIPRLHSPRRSLGLGRDTLDQVMAIGGKGSNGKPLKTMEVLEADGGNFPWRWNEYPLPDSLEACILPSVFL
ncbi:unnamed protein product [Darwinula stevensoni]|uniref:DUF4817 domain-containing protein n=1 Tax=Darwinula stevensoni TaxID=69355 RepID=A0A7R8X4E1_9CRUS|nr:unnamed protein product [Darwinula stevensoni]CAG0885908.1 unnamed protein product [Darwinula stevensoni]